jgi:uncharacterized damage-inducible protein DinB
VPEKQLSWKPHAKSMTLGRLASHIAETPSWAKPILTTELFNMDPATYKPTDFTTVKDLLAAFDKNVAAATGIMKAAKDEELLKTWTFQSAGKTIFAMPRIGVLRVMIFSHLIHHRGQLSVYLRLRDVPLPSVYGPSADTPKM